MTDQTAGDDLGEDVELETEPRKKGLPGKKIVLFIGVPLLLLIGAAVGLWVTGMADQLLGSDKSQTAEESQADTVFYKMPTMLVNLNSGDGGSNFLKLTVSLELASEAEREKIKTMTPRIVDNFQVYLRELRVEDLEGSAGLQRLREELLLRVNNAVEGAQVQDVLFKEMLVQ